jgi:hypothetical protein
VPQWRAAGSSSSTAVWNALGQRRQRGAQRVAGASGCAASASLSSGGKRCAQNCAAW